MKNQKKKKRVKKMSKYTSELRFYCEQYNINQGIDINNTKISDLIETFRPFLFDFSYPIFDENHKKELETKIIKHFYTREIGFETYGLFRLKLDEKMNLIMPYYNQLYKSEQLNYDPLSNYKMDEKQVREGIGKQETNGTTSGTGKNIYSEFPQARLSGNTDYATNANEDESTTSSNGTTNVNSNETFTRNVEGNIGKSNNELLMEYRNTFLNIDEKIIHELDDLFMLVY